MCPFADFPPSLGLNLMKCRWNPRRGRRQSGTSRRCRRPGRRACCTWSSGRPARRRGSCGCSRGWTSASPKRYVRKNASLHLVDIQPHHGSPFTGTSNHPQLDLFSVRRGCEHMPARFSPSTADWDDFLRGLVVLAMYAGSRTRDGGVSIRRRSRCLVSLPDRPPGVRVRVSLQQRRDPPLHVRFFVAFR